MTRTEYDTIRVGPLDWRLLREQRDWLLNHTGWSGADGEAVEGLLALLDSMLDYGHENGLIGEDDEPVV